MAIRKRGFNGGCRNKRENKVAISLFSINSSYTKYVRITTNYKRSCEFKTIPVYLNKILKTNLILETKIWIIYYDDD